MYRGKRTLDIVIASSGLAVTLPIQIVAAVVVRVTMGSPVLFTQVRSGINGEPFILRKFRTMHPEDHARGWTDDASRLTGIGKVLRSSSIDELPTLWSVLRGDMSIVGPRPLLVRYLQRYSEEQARRLLVLPGMTGLAQVNGRNAQSWDERFKYDVEYVDACSLALDLLIVARTIKLVLSREGVSAPGEATKGEFFGDIG